MQESWPAWGGSTSVGTTRLRPATEKSRSRISGVSNTISCGVVQEGACRVVAVSIQRDRSNAAGPRSSAAAQHLPRPSKVAAAPSNQLSRSPDARLGDGAGGHCETGLMFDLLGETLKAP